MQINESKMPFIYFLFIFCESGLFKGSPLEAPVARNHARRGP
jgi:hypothetical protein